ncbi:MAG TPA: DUF4383 domain-containing protein [Gemmatimonadaceae bacterium]
MVQTVARVFGFVFLLVAALGFLASGMSMEADPALAPRVLGLFPVNALHNVVHLLFGVWGLAASRAAASATMYAKAAGAIYLVLAVLGFVAPTTFGLIPIGGHDIWLHALLGGVLVAVGFTAPRTATA